MSKIKKGFLLTEVMIALFVVASCGVVLARYYAATLTLQQEAAHYLHAVNLGKQALMNGAQGTRQEKYDGMTFDIETTIHDFATPHCLLHETSKTKRLNVFKEVHVAVRWNLYDSKNKIFVLRSADSFPLEKL